MPTGTKNPVTAGCGFHHISIITPDFAESLRLYRDVLGMAVRLQLDSGGRPFALLDMGDGGYVEVAGLRADQSLPPAGGTLLHFALAVSDAHAATQAVRQAGFPITVEPKDIRLGDLSATIAFFTGPSGESVELFEEH